jgi:uncharacterized protein (TIGR03435 family)
MSRFLVLMVTAGLHAQPAFEVASVKPAAPPTRGMSMEIEPGGRFTATDVSLRSLLKKAYGIRDFQIQNPPAWFDSQRYDVYAKPMGSAGEQQVERMLQSLLADRFQLKFHREPKDFQVYVLTLAKNGPKLKQAAAEENVQGGVRLRGVGSLTGIHASTLQLAEALSGIVLNGRHILDRPVLDQTALSGSYDFSLQWTPDPTPSEDAPPIPTSPSIFTAVQEQLGLKLETRKAPVDLFIIDHVERASEN